MKATRVTAASASVAITSAAATSAWFALFASGMVMAAEPAPTPPAKPASAAADAMPAVKSPATPAAEAPARRVGSDRLDLGTTVVTGNRELPKVLYIVPWKRSDLGDLPPQPLNSLLDEVLTPVDRDVFRREVTYYGAMTGTGGATTSSPASPAVGSEK